MDKVISEVVNYPLSDTDIRLLLRNKTNIVRYRDMHTFHNIDQLIMPHGNCVILYETSENMGHWCCLVWRGHDQIEFFDPYGKSMDSQLKYIHPHFARATHQDQMYLTRLVNHSKYKLYNNKTAFQKLRSDVKSCGRWCCLRIIMHDMKPELFKRMFQDLKGDDIAAFLTTHWSSSY